MADLRVRATKMLFYRGMRIKPGTTFTLDEAEHFSTTGMEWAPEARDELAAAVEASPKQRGPDGLTMRQKRPGMSTKASLTPDQGI